MEHFGTLTSEQKSGREVFTFTVLASWPWSSKATQGRLTLWPGQRCIPGAGRTFTVPRDLERLGALGAVRRIDGEALGRSARQLRGAARGGRNSRGPSEATRQVLKLKASGLNVSQIALRCGKTPGAVRKILYRDRASQATQATRHPSPHESVTP